jgi:hypothetical protein
MRLEDKGALVCIAAILANRIHSTQFHLWFYPFVILGLLAEPARAVRRMVPLLAALDLTNVLVYPFAFAYAYGEMDGFAPFAARAAGAMDRRLLRGHRGARGAPGGAGRSAPSALWTGRAAGPIIRVSDAPHPGVRRSE